jgi:hypothetical protein
MRTRYFLSALALAAVFYACQKEVKQIPVSSTDVSNACKVKTVDPVTISVTGSSEVSIDIKVTAGKSGTPSGFFIQWAAADQLAAYTGPVDKDGWPLDTTVFCKASFSGKVSKSRYALKQGQSVTVSIGNLLLDNGASTDCPDNLAGCGTEYVFRAFAYANGSLIKSPWSNLLPTATQVGNCGSGGL